MTYKEIPLTRGFVTIVDEADYDWLMNWKWCVTINKTLKPYVMSGSRKNKIIMHRIITNAPKGVFVDHINENTLDNRRDNLRLCNYAGNSRNRSKFKGKSSKYKGVSWNKKSSKWKVTIQAKGKPLHLGMFDDETIAAVAYDEAAIKYHGEFANLNFSSLLSGDGHSLEN